jgi:hypothetical protein
MMQYCTLSAVLAFSLVSMIGYTDATPPPTHQPRLSEIKESGSAGGSSSAITGYRPNQNANEQRLSAEGGIFAKYTLPASHEKPTKEQIIQSKLAQKNTGVEALDSKSTEEAENKPEAWQESFADFLTHFGTIVGDSPTWPTEGQFAVLAASDAEGKTIFLIPQIYPLALTDREKSTTVFKDKPVTWELEVKKVVNDTKNKKVVVLFKEPDKKTLQAANRRFGEKFAYFAAAIAESDKKKALEVRNGEKVRIKAKIGSDILKGVDLWFGVGKYAGQIAPYIFLQDAVFEKK